MSFLQPYILAALPLAAIPILIHLVNRRRHRSVEWGAMRFLLAARKMNTGRTRLRHFLILLMRTLAIAALVFSISRPLTSSWLRGLGSGRVDATIVLLDRSASMESSDLSTGASKRSTSLSKLEDLLQSRGYGNDLILIDSATTRPLRLRSPDELLTAPETAPTATAGNLVEMLDEAIEYIDSNEVGRADIWICSDLQATNWQLASGRWAAIRERLASSKNLHIFLLSYTDEQVNDNLSVRVSNVRVRNRNELTELSLDISIQRAATSTAKSESIPVEIEVNQVKTSLPITIDQTGGAIKGHTIAINGDNPQGWGSVTLPADTNSADNRFYFVFAEPSERLASVVCETPDQQRALALSLEIPAESGGRNRVERHTSNRPGAIDWQHSSLVVWQGALPTGLVAEQIINFVASGRVALFLPPVAKSQQIDASSDVAAHLFNAKWINWETVPEESRALSWWSSDNDILANVGSGAPLPLDELTVLQKRNLARTTNQANAIVLAKTSDGAPLLSRLPMDEGRVYFLHTLPTDDYSSFERDAISFYVMLQRCLEIGSQALMPAMARDASRTLINDQSDWQTPATFPESPLSRSGLQAGVLKSKNRWLAVNRPVAEDSGAIVPRDNIDAQFQGVQFQRIDDSVTAPESLASEIWRVFLIAMLVALAAEATLCLPPKRVDVSAPSTAWPRKSA